MGKGKPFDRLKKWWKIYVGLEDYIALFLMIVGVVLHFLPPELEQQNFYSLLFDLRTELIGAGIATLLIGNASQAAQIKEEKKRLILQMGSPDNGFAVEAVRQLRERGWLQDGSLKKANLERANLSGADLEESNLSGVDLKESNLSGADLWSANLRGTYLFRANLSGASLRSADLSGASLGLTVLNGADLRLADLTGADLGGADLSRARLFDERTIACVLFDETTNWKDAFYTEGEHGTVFPEGFSPADYGLHLIRGDESYKDAYWRVNPFGDINCVDLQ